MADGRPDWRTLRARLGLSQRQLAQLVGVRMATVVDWESDRRNGGGPGRVEGVAWAAWQPWLLAAGRVDWPCDIDRVHLLRLVAALEVNLDEPVPALKEPESTFLQDVLLERRHVWRSLEALLIQ